MDKHFSAFGLNRLVLTSTDGAPGDSGGPLLRSADFQAVGVLKGGGGGGVFYSHIEYVLNRLDATLIRNDE